MNRQKYMPALAEAKQYCIDFALDYHVQKAHTCEMLAYLAHKYGYRKPRNANGSTGRYFYSLLQRLNNTPE